MPKKRNPNRPKSVNNRKVEIAAEMIQGKFKEIVKKQTLNSFVLGGNAVFELLEKVYVKPIREAKNEEERNEAINDLIEKIEEEVLNIQKQKEEFERKVEDERRNKSKKGRKTE